MDENPKSCPRRARCPRAGRVAAAIASCMLAAAGPSAPREWVEVAPKPEFNPGFAGIPDDSEAGPVLKCTGPACQARPTLCTARVHPEKPGLWHGMTTRTLLKDRNLGVLARVAFIDDDVDRLAPGSPWTPAMRGPGAASFSDGILSEAGGHAVIVSTITYASPASTQAFHTVVWLDADRLHRIVCSVGRDGSASGEDALDFAARH